MTTIPSGASEAFALFTRAECEPQTVPAELVRELLAKLGDLLEGNPNHRAAAVGSVAGAAACIRELDAMTVESVLASFRSIALAPTAPAGRSRRPTCRCGKHLIRCECGGYTCPGWQHKSTTSHWCQGGERLADPITNTEA